MTELFHSRYTYREARGGFRVTVEVMTRAVRRLEDTRAGLETGLACADRRAVESLAGRLRRRLRAAEIRDRWALARGRLSRLDLLDRRTGRLLLAVQLSEMVEHLGDGWDGVRLEDLLVGFGEHVEFRPGLLAK